MVELSICLATYNGSAFLREQLASILPQLGVKDELIVIDDASTDDTVAILESFRDSRIRIFRHTANRGIIKTFEHALKEASGEFLFLSDQDDIWHPEKVAKTCRAFQSSRRPTLVMTDVELIDEQGSPIRRQEKEGGPVSLGIAANLIKNRFRGCTMAFRRQLLDAVLPFPDGIPMHDSWIGIISAIVGRTEYLPEPLVRYRRHSGSATRDRRGPALQIVMQRWELLSALVCRSPRLFHTRLGLRVPLAQDYSAT